MNMGVLWSWLYSEVVAIGRRFRRTGSGGTWGVGGRFRYHLRHLTGCFLGAGSPLGRLRKERRKKMRIYECLHTRCLRIEFTA